MTLTNKEKVVACKYNVILDDGREVLFVDYIDDSDRVIDSILQDSNGESILDEELLKEVGNFVDSVKDPLGFV